ncbi:DUF1572 family protein [Aurantibacillus circumpalustris]|uniref:DUF1572 family protein n=1 Tax=Aurantibacillus circumpalustris TaxID=3036359 RepID=UPI00295C16E3|nr:DUF1572 family protein [Aurantibacillus circumpalustris]
MNTDYLESAKKQFAYYKLLGEKTVEQLKDKDLFYKYNDDSNSIAVIIKHLHGNMMSRWTDFLTTDGEKEWRQRDEEFEEPEESKEAILKLWNEAWNCLFNTLNSLSEEDLSKTIYIRNQGHSVTEAINRQLAHYPYHVGQIVFIGKMLSNAKWNSLSIPKNASKEYNAEKFSKEKHTEHFTDEILKKNKK